MPVWLARLLWMLRGKRLVRLHLIDADPSLEGILAGRWRHHYILLSPKLLETENQTRAIDGHVEVPAERVLFVQVLAKGLR
jgi:hypothetical protein